MYMYGGKSGNKNQLLTGVVCLILGVALGVSIAGTTPIMTDDVDRIYIGPLITHTGTEADNLFFAIRGERFNDVGNIYDRCTKQVFDIGDLEVNKLIYSVTISDENALIYILSNNMTSPDEFIILDQIQQFGEINGEIGINHLYDITIVVFYYGVKLISIAGLLEG